MIAIRKDRQVMGLLLSAAASDEAGSVLKRPDIEIIIRTKIEGKEMGGLRQAETERSAEDSYGWLLVC